MSEDPFLPPELQLQILRLAIPPFKRCPREETVGRNREVSAYSLVNTAWRDWAQPEIFHHLQVEELFQLRNLLEISDGVEAPRHHPQILTLGRAHSRNVFPDFHSIQQLHRKFSTIPQVEVLGGTDVSAVDVLSQTCLDGVIFLRFISVFFSSHFPLPALHALSPYKTIRHLHVELATNIDFSLLPNLTALFCGGGPLSPTSDIPIILPSRLIALGTWYGSWSPAPASLQLLEMRSELLPEEKLPPTLRIWRITTLAKHASNITVLSQIPDRLPTLPSLERIEVSGYWSKKSVEVVQFREACLSIKPSLKILHQSRLAFGGKQGYDKFRETGFWDTVRELEARADLGV